MYYWSTLPVTIVFITNAFGHLYYGHKLYKKFPEEHNFLDTILLFFLWLAAGIIYPLYYLIDNPVLGDYLTICTFFVCVFTPFMIFLILYYQKRKVKRDPSVRERRNVSDFLEKYDEINKYNAHSYKTDLRRKTLHLFPAAMIIVLWVFAVYIWSDLWNQDAFWGITGEDFSRILILTAGYSGILIFAALDYVRLSSHIFERNLYHLLPDNVTNLLGKTIKRGELFEFTKPATLVLAFATVFFFPFPIFCAASLIATIGDGAASVLGKGFGRIHIPKNSPKTLVGYIAGFSASFGVSFLSLLIFGAGISLIKITLISLAGATVFFIIDILNLNLDDNILNPILSAIVMFLLYLLI